MADRKAWDEIARPLIEVVAAYGNFTEERFIQSLVDGLSQTEGIQVRITEEVVNPSGDVTVVRDDIFDNRAGAESSAAGEDQSFGYVAAGESALLGLDADGVRERWQAIISAHALRA